MYLSKTGILESLASALLCFGPVRKMDVVVVASHQVLYNFTANPVNMMVSINGGFPTKPIIHIDWK